MLHIPSTFDRYSRILASSYSEAHLHAHAPRVPSKPDGPGRRPCPPSPCSILHSTTRSWCTGAAAEIWTGFAKQEVEHAKSEGLKVQDVGKEHLPYLDRDVDHYYTANRIFDRVFESDMACPFLEYSRTGAWNRSD